MLLILAIYGLIIIVTFISTVVIEQVNYASMSSEYDCRKKTCKEQLNRLMNTGLVS